MPVTLTANGDSSTQIITHRCSKIGGWIPDGWNLAKVLNYQTPNPTFLQTIPFIKILVWVTDELNQFMKANIYK